MKYNSKILFLLVLICMSTVAFGQVNECENFKNGKFKIVDPVIGNSIIERNDSTQIEYSERSKLKIEFKVAWLNDCMYTLEVNKVLENPHNIKFPEGLKLTIEIIETKENSYIQKSTSNLFDRVVECELILIE